MDGFFATKARVESVEETAVDVITTHHYPILNVDFIGDVRATREMTRGKKPYIVGEFGFEPNGKVEELLDYVIEDGVSGAMVWSLRTHKREGGFYWHSEPDASGRFRSYHWPGFTSGDSFYETPLLTLMRRMAFQIAGLPEAPLEPPSPPNLLAIDDVTAICWQGSTGAACYDIQRAVEQDGPWELIGWNISDAQVEYGSLFNDTTAQIGKQYFYRIIAKNSAGCSAPSNTVRSSVVEYLAIVDELCDWSQVYSIDGQVELEFKEARRMKEDGNRAKGAAGGQILYRTRGPISSCILETFFEKNVVDFAFFFSSDGYQFYKAKFRKTQYDSGDPVYGYYIPVKYEVSNSLADARWFRIVFRGRAQIGRIRILYNT